MASQLYNRASRLILRSKVLTGHKMAETISANSSRLPILVRSSPQWQSVAFISTSKKDRETITAEITTTDQGTKAETHTKKRSWQTYGYDWDDEDTDRNYANLVFFWTVTVGVVGMGFIMTYWPDHQLRNWSQREAHIELARREALGLPLIDPNLVPPETVNLPTEEELGDFEIII